MMSVSVLMITYNHEAYIAQAIEGVLMQKTSFPVELVIGEDCSSDNTRNICKEYQEKYPQIIKLLLPEINLGMQPNFIATIKECKGKYIALCEGDDYWTDPYKLQKQVDFLEVNSDFSFCAGNIKHVDQNDNSLFDTWPDISKDIILTEKHIGAELPIPTLTIVFRRDYLTKLDYNLLSLVTLGDYILNNILLSKGNCYVFFDFFGCYRHQSIGVYSVLNIKEKIKIGLKNNNLLKFYFLRKIKLKSLYYSFINIRQAKKKFKLYING